MKQSLEVLISALNKDAAKLVSGMGLECDAVVVDQTDRDAVSSFELENGCSVHVYERNERGIGRSRNLALDKASADIVLFSDEDIVYEKGYADSILKAFDEHPDADIIMFNVDVNEGRRTYHIEKECRVHRWSLGRYPAYAAAARREKLAAEGVRFSLLFGGGAPYSNGEDSLFYMDCVKAGLKIMAVPVKIGTEIERPSTWFHGYDEKFFKDRGVLYHFLYGKMAGIWARRFIFAKKKKMCRDIKPADALRLMKAGIEEGKKLSKNGS